MKPFDYYSKQKTDYPNKKDYITLYAYDSAPFVDYDIGDRVSIAAVLRAAADQCKIKWNYHPDYPETESVVVVSDLLDIAKELKNV